MYSYFPVLGEKVSIFINFQKIGQILLYQENKCLLFFTTYSPLYGEKVTTFKVDTYSPNIGEYVHTLKLVTFSPHTGE